jgi:HNH endonuclease
MAEFFVMDGDSSCEKKRSHGKKQQASHEKKNSEDPNPTGNAKVKHAVRMLVWSRWIGMSRGTAPCWCCKSHLINMFEFEAGHVHPRSAGGADTVENLRPICRPCNSSMGTMNLFDFQKLHGFTSSNSEWSIFASISSAFRWMIGSNG